MTDVFKIESRVTELVQKHQDLQRKATALEKNVGQLTSKNEALARELAEYKDKYKALQISKAFLNPGEDAHLAKKAIQEVLREVDNCIALLGND